MSEQRRINHARVEWTDKQYEEAVDARINLMDNGWVYFYETDTYHPPHTIDKITDGYEKENDD